MSAQLKKEFLELRKKYLNGTASPAEIQLLEQYYALFSEEENATDQLTQQEIADLEECLEKGIQRRITARQKPVVPFYKKSYVRAASVIIFALSAVLFIKSRQNGQQAPEHITTAYDIHPGGNKAILTLSNGSKLTLNDSKNGFLATQSGSVVVKNDSILSYQRTGNTSERINYNTITTPKGGQYQLVLADGTRVWLNAASSLKFPTVFNGRDRSVELTGEAYFEVAKNKAKPFNVKTATQTVQVLGTHFDINSYEDEAGVKTTLLEGSVKIKSVAGSVTISPGQQAILSGSQLLVNKDLDTDEVVAWKNGMFQFNEGDIQTIMHQIERWYDIDVVFKGSIPNYTYHGKISRNVNVTQVLKILELSGINFTIEGRKIIVGA
ncbi:FecR family protein [Mucilaginibacter corticis]|uniref:FecR family protein n=1 Tax=Mucilaginibacter corticis TaxID=2597670 RepID=A0A556MJY3_9SPHI|nr:FecR family protein [Mucilaginibacter corticis]TSJ40218.1 FecR family protein [Mucilaginibacter corticis]